MDERPCVWVIEVKGGLVDGWRSWSEGDVRFDQNKAEWLVHTRRMKFPNLKWRIVEYRRVEEIIGEGRQ